MTVGPLFFAPAAGGGGGGGGGGTVISLNHFDGTHGATTTTDQVAGVSWFVWTNAKISNVQARFGGTSLEGDWSWGGANITTNAELEMGTGDFTYEFAVFLPAVDNGPSYLLDGRSRGGGAGTGLALYNNYGTLQTQAAANNATGTLTANAWHWIAVTREAGTLRTYINGTLVGTQTDTNNYNANQVHLLRNYGSSGRVHGFIDEFRITKGTARYTGASYTVPTAPFPNP